MGSIIRLSLRRKLQSLQDLHDNEECEDVPEETIKSVGAWLDTHLPATCEDPDVQPTPLYELTGIDLIWDTPTHEMTLTVDPSDWTGYWRSFDLDSHGVEEFIFNMNDAMSCETFREKISQLID